MNNGKRDNEDEDDDDYGEDISFMTRMLFVGVVWGYTLEISLLQVAGLV